MDFEKSKEDLEYYGDRKDEINNNSKCASDFWIEYDRVRYQDNKIFKSLIDDIKNIDTNKYKKIMEEENIC